MNYICKVCSCKVEVETFNDIVAAGKMCSGCKFSKSRAKSKNKYILKDKENERD